MKCCKLHVLPTPVSKRLEHFCHIQVWSLYLWKPCAKLVEFYLVYQLQGNYLGYNWYRSEPDRTFPWIHQFCLRKLFVKWIVKRCDNFCTSVHVGGSMAECSACQTRSPAVPGSSSALTTTWLCFLVVSRSNPRPGLQIANWFASG